MPPRRMPAVAQKHEEPLTHEVWQPSFKTPGVFTHSCHEGKKPKKQKPRVVIHSCFLKLQKELVGKS